MELADLKTDVNKILKDTFSELALTDDSPFWNILMRIAVNSDVTEEDVTLFIACYYVWLKYKDNSTQTTDNKEAIKVGSSSYEGTGNRVFKLNKAINILDAMGYISLNIGVVSGD